MGTEQSPWPQYANPPLVEAACDFRFFGRESWDPTITGLFYAQVRRQFPEKRTVPHVEAAVTADDMQFRSRLATTLRTEFRRKDGSQAVAIGPDQLLVSHLRPYRGWPVYRPFIERMLSTYIQIARPEGFARIGLRYINRIRIPGEAVDLARYLDFLPYIGSGFPDTYGDFGVVVTFAYADGRDQLRVNLHTFANVDEAERAGDSVFDLDFDYFLTQPKVIGVDSALEWVDVAHANVEAAFEAALKDPLRDLFGRKPGDG